MSKNNYKVWTVHCGNCGKDNVDINHKNLDSNGVGLICQYCGGEVKSRDGHWENAPAGFVHGESYQATGELMDKIVAGDGYSFGTGGGSEEARENHLKQINMGHDLHVANQKIQSLEREIRELKDSGAIALEMLSIATGELWTRNGCPVQIHTDWSRKEGCETCSIANPWMCWAEWLKDEYTKSLTEKEGL